MTSTTRANRKRTEIVLPAYTHVSGRLCIYCGQISDTKDHVPAVSTVWAYGTEYFAKLRIPLVAYPACRECNSTLGNRSTRFDLKSRAIHLYEKYRKKYCSLLQQPEWEVDEIDALDYSLASYIERAELLRSWIERRLRFMEEIYEL